MTLSERARNTQLLRLTSRFNEYRRLSSLEESFAENSLGLFKETKSKMKLLFREAFPLVESEIAVLYSFMEEETFVLVTTDNLYSLYSGKVNSVNATEFDWHQTGFSSGLKNARTKGDIVFLNVAKRNGTRIDIPLKAGFASIVFYNILRDFQPLPSDLS